MRRCGWGPYRDGISLEPDDLLRGMEENGFVASVVGIDDNGHVIGWATLNAASMQFASPPGGVFGDHLVVDPAFRSGVVAGNLMAALQTEVFELGYGRVDAMVEPDNDVARATYRRVGFRQISDEACEDGALLLESHMPMLVGYLRSVGVESRLLHRGTGDPRLYMLALRPPRGPLGASEVRDHHSCESLDYELHFEDDRVELTVDRTLGAVSRVRHDEVCEIDVWPSSGRSIDVGDPATLVVEIHNLGAASLEVSVEPTALSGAPRVPASTAEVVAPGSSMRHEVPAHPRAPGRCRLDVDVVVRRGDCARRWPLSTSFEARTASSELDANWWSGPRGQDRWALDLRTGVLSARRAGTVVVSELWPDLGPPFPGGHKTPIPRRLHVVDADDSMVLVRSPANGWVELHPSLAGESTLASDGVELERRITQLDDGVVRIETTVVAPGGVDAFSGLLRIWPRVLLDDACLVEPKPVASIVDDGPLPWSNTNFEFLRDVSLPSDPSTLERPWSIFEGGDASVGLHFEGASEVRFGGRWMPSVLYEINAVAGSVSSPAYHLVVAETADDVRALLESISGSVLVASGAP